MIDGRGIDRNMGVGILLAQMIGGDGPAVPHDVKTAADDARAAHFGSVQVAKIAQRGIEARLVSRGRMGDGGGDQE